MKLGSRVVTLSFLVFLGGLVLVGWHLADPDHCPRGALLCDPSRCRRAVDPAPGWQCPLGQGERLVDRVTRRLDDVINR